MSKHQDTWREMVTKAKQSYTWKWAQASNNIQWNLYWYRKHLGMTQAELAKKMGTKQPGVARYESQGYTPTLDMLAKFAHAFGCEIADIVGEPKFFNPQNIYNDDGEKIGAISIGNSPSTITLTSEAKWSLL